MIRCYYIIVVRMFVGLLVDFDIRYVSLCILLKRSLKRSDKKLGWKKLWINDVDIVIYFVLDFVFEKDIEFILKILKFKKKLKFDF